MKRKERYIARLDEVIITREGDSAVIRYKEEGILTTHLQIGPEIAGMSDEAILELFNDTLRAQARLAAEDQHFFAWIMKHALGGAGARRGSLPRIALWCKTAVDGRRYSSI